MHHCHHVQHWTVHSADHCRVYSVTRELMPEPLEGLCGINLEIQGPHQHPSFCCGPCGLLCPKRPVKHQINLLSQPPHPHDRLMIGMTKRTEWIDGANVDLHPHAHICARNKAGPLSTGRIRLYHCQTDPQIFPVLHGAAEHQPGVQGHAQIMPAGRAQDRQLRPAPLPIS